MEPAAHPAPVLEGAATIGWRSHAVALQAAMTAEAGRPAAAGLAMAMDALARADLAGALDGARQALAADAACAIAWRIAGLAHEGQGQMVEALDAYQQAYALDPQAPGVLADLGRLARALDLHDAAVELLTLALAADPASPDLAHQLAAALGDAHRYGEAVAVLQTALQINPGDAFLWDGLGAVLLQRGDTPAALESFEQALALGPDGAESAFHRAQARFELGDAAGAEADCDALLARLAPAPPPAIRFLRSQARLTQGNLEGGWADYAARLDPAYDKAPAFAVDGRLIEPGTDLEGRHVLVVGEQGVGDEMMFAGMIPDLIEAVGPQGRVHLAVSPRLVPLFARSFPAVTATPYALSTVDGRPRLEAPGAAADLWIPLGQLAALFRRERARFDRAEGFLRPDPARVAHWRARLDALGPGPRIGLTWRSMKTSSHRLKQYPRFEDWTPVFRLPGVRLVSLQYGDCAEDIEAARRLGADLWRPEGVDLTNDLDEAAAVSAAVDVAIGVGNASVNLAGAVGTPAWIVGPPAAWPRLGTDHYPWFPRSRAFIAPSYGDWGPALAAAADAAAELAIAGAFRGA